MKHLVDARFLHHSGIGRHIAGVLGAWTPPPGVAVVRDPGDAPAGWTPHPCTAGMYSLAEQGPALRRLARHADVTWFPHYAHPWRCAGRWVCTVHDVIHLAMPELFPGRLRRCAAHGLLADVRDRAAAVCFVSRFGQEEFHRLVGRPRGAEHIVGNGVDPQWSLPAPAPPASGPKPYVVAVGNLKPHKGLGHLLRAMQAPGLVDLDLVIIGRRDGLRTVDGSLEAAAAALGGRCRWTGPVGDAELRSWVGHARMLAFPSLYEGFGLPPLEAMAAGIPVVASRIPAVVEVCGDAALLVPPGEPDALAVGIATLHTDAALRQRLVGAGSACAARWTWGATAHATWTAMCAAARQ